MSHLPRTTGRRTRRTRLRVEQLEGRAVPAAVTARDPWREPFSSDSIWNTPIGDGASYAAAGLTFANGIGYDHEHFVRQTTTDPIRTTYLTGSWDNRDNGTTPSYFGNTRVPDSLLIPDSVNDGGFNYYTPNEASTFLDPNGRSFFQVEPVTRPTAGGPIWLGYPQSDFGDPATEASLFTKGRRGTHFGSGLSAIGGSLRRGELTGSDPIRHALKINVWGVRYLAYNANTDPTPGYRWPAANADGYAGGPGGYGGTNPQLEMGSLLAVPWNTSESNVGGLESNVGRKLFQALKEYGGYVVDDTGLDDFTFCGEWGVTQDVQAATGHSMTGGVDSSPITRDIYKIFKALNVVTNSGENSVGGPGNRRVAGALPLAYGVRKSIGGTTQIEAEDYNADYGYSDADASQNGAGSDFGRSGTLPDPFNRPSSVDSPAYRVDGVDVRASGDGDDGARGNYVVGWTAPGEWLNYDVNVAAGGSYDVTFRVSSGAGGGNFRLEQDGANVSGSLRVNGTGGWDSFVDVTARVNLSAGDHTLRFVCETGGFDFNFMRFQPAGGGTNPVVDGGVYEIIPANAPGRRLDVRDFSGAGPTQLYDDGNSGNQRWRLEHRGGGWYEITPQHATGSRLDVYGSGNEAVVGTWADNDQTNQRFRFEDQGGGFFEIIPQHDQGRRLDAKYSGTGNGTEVWLYEDNNTGAQRWRLELQLNTADFNDVAVGSRPAGPEWTYGTAGGAVDVQAVRSASDRSLRLSDTSTTGSGVFANKTFAANPNRLTVEFDLRLDQLTDGFAFSLMSGGTRAVTVGSRGGKFGYANSAGAWVQTARSIAANAWANVRLVADSRTDRFSLFVDGQLLAGDVTFRSAVTSLGAWRAETPGAGTGTMYLDNVRVTA